MTCPQCQHENRAAAKFCERSSIDAPANRDLAQAHLVTATSMFRDMAMAYWLAQAQAESSAGAC